MSSLSMLPARRPTKVSLDRIGQTLWDRTDDILDQALSADIRRLIERLKSIGKTGHRDA